MRIALFLVAASCAGRTAAPQAALVPHVTPVRGNGQPAAGDVELSLGGATLASADDPELTDPEAALAVARTEIDAGVALRSKRIPEATFRLMYSHGLRAGAHRLSDNEMPSRDVFGVGFGASYSIEVTERFRLGLAGEIHGFRVPFVRGGSEGVDQTGVFGLGALPSYQLGRTTLYGSLSMKTHPTIDSVGDLAEEEPVSTGEPVALWSLGVERELGDSGARAGISVFAPLSSRPVRYSATVGAHVTVALSREP